MIQTRNALATSGRVAAVALAILSCGERREHGPAGTVAFRLASRSDTRAGAATARSAGDSTILSLGRDSIIIRRVELVLKDIQLAPVEAGECDPEERDEEPCAALEMGPAVVPLPLSERAGAPVSVSAPAGKYIVFHFAFYAPDSNRDREFLAAHPGVAGTSVRVEGTFIGSGKRAPFVYASAFNEEHETGLLPALALEAGATANLTLRLDLATWFLNADKTAFIDPRTAGAGGPNQQLVHDNIRTSVAAFRDDNFDGLDDHETAIQMQSYISPWSPPPPEGEVHGARGAPSVPAIAACRERLPRLTADSIGPFRLNASLTDLQRDCPNLWYGWETDPDGFPVPAVAARLGPALVTALLTDTLPTAVVRQVGVTDEGPKTVEGLGVGSTLGELQRAYGVPGASEPGCVLRVWFATRRGLAFRMEFPSQVRRECGGLSEPPLPPELRVAAVVLVPR